MKRRNFLKTIVGIVGAAVAGLKVKAVPAPPPIPVSESIHTRFAWGEARDANRIHIWCSREQVEVYKRLGCDLGRNEQVKPVPGLAHLVNNGGSVAMFSRVTYPELNAPTLDLQ